ncbi:hypothetical protein IAT40_001066 [Kwoniella sp. CBS 6097]
MHSYSEEANADYNRLEGNPTPSNPTSPSPRADPSSASLHPVIANERAHAAATVPQTQAITQTKTEASLTGDVAKIISEYKETVAAFLPAILMVLAFVAMDTGSKFSKLSKVTEEVKDLKEVMSGMRDEIRLLREVLERKL